MNVLIEAIRKFIDGEKVTADNNYQLYVSVQKRNGFFGKKTEMILLLILFNDTLFIEDIFKSVDHFIAEQKLKRKPKLYWFVFSSRGGIYLYEMIAGQLQWKKSKYPKRLCVGNPDNGVVCLKPGHIKNKILSDRLAFLMEQYRFYEKGVWEREVGDVFKMCLIFME